MTITLLHGDCRELLPTLPDRSVQCIVTSPPYYGLRRYTSDPREIGNEATPFAYVTALVAVFAEVWRVLRDDGVLWLNLGDSYSGGKSGRADMDRPNGKGIRQQSTGKLGLYMRHDNKPPDGIPAKNLLGMPWRVAFALQDAGWILRSDIIWAKPNCMPESVTDRPTRAHEYLFLFAKQARYYYDATAIEEESAPSSKARAKYNGGSPSPKSIEGTAAGVFCGPPTTGRAYGQGRNKRSVWEIATQPFSGAHFATMPEALIEPCILAGSSAQACETCGAAWGRVVESTGHVNSREAAHVPNNTPTKTDSTGWQPTTRSTDRFIPRCACAANTGSARSVVLDPFGGSGTVARVADRYQRDAILIDLNQDYIELQEQRTNGVQKELFV